MTTSFLALGLALRNVFYRDYKIPLAGASLLTLGVPVTLFALGLRDFILILSIIGVFALGLVGTMGVVTYWMARSRGEEVSVKLVPYWLGTSAGVAMIIMFLLSMASVGYEWFTV